MTALSSDSNRTEMAKLKPSAVAGDSSARHKVSTMVEQKESIVALGSIGGAVDDQKDQIIRMLRGRVDELEEKLKRVLPNVCSRCAVDAVDDLELAPISEAKLAALQQQAELKQPYSDHGWWAELRPFQRQVSTQLSVGPATTEPDVF